MPRNAHAAPVECPLCKDAEFEDANWSGVNVRVYGCGMFFDCHNGYLSYRYLTADGARDVATEHFRRQLGEGVTFVGRNDVW